MARTHCTFILPNSGCGVQQMICAKVHRQKVCHPAWLQFVLVHHPQLSGAAGKCCRSQTSWGRVHLTRIAYHHDHDLWCAQTEMMDMICHDIPQYSSWIILQVLYTNIINNHKRPGHLYTPGHRRKLKPKQKSLHPGLLQVFDSASNKSKAIGKRLATASNL